MRSSLWKWCALGLALAASAACLSEDVRVCADGSVCPDFLACSPAGGCVEEALLCEVSGAPCDLPGGEAGLCRAGVCVQPRCGDGVVDEVLGEMCDDRNAIDGDGCARDCASNEQCGNGVRDPLEGCDDGNEVDTDECTNACGLPTCGDGVVQAGEACDEGAGNSETGACLPTCVAASCGDGRVQAGVEACDLGGANADDGPCLVTCEPATCGDDHVWAGVEDCDDGNTDDGDGCQGNCALPRCGDGIEDPDEACDDGAENSETGACRLTCEVATCGDGRLWAGVEACDHGVDNGDDQGCTSLCEVATCGDDLVWAGVEACDDGNHTPGDGCQADCTLPRCGDAILDPGEVCDDGNNTPGDGCMFDCSSDEVCGNGLIDLFRGEACDDANPTAYDGCTRCQPDAPPLWTQHGQTPRPRAGAAMAYDPYRQVVVLYGGDANVRLADTWEWDGRAWLQRFPVHGPGRLAFHAMAYDPQRRRTVLVGGLGVGGPSARTWEWDGIDWVEASGEASALGPVYGHAIAYAVEQHQMVLAGGVDRDGKTFVRENDQWIEVGQLPTWLAFAAMVTEPRTGRVILAGGVADATDVTDQVWRWDGGSWSSLPSLPIRVSHHVLVVDRHNQIHLIGGMDAGLEERNWQWTLDSLDGDWSPAPDVGTPNRNAAAAWDLARDQAVVFGGTSNASGLIDTTMLIDPAGTASQVPAPPSPGALERASMTYDAWRGQLVLVGGTELAAFNPDTWLWDGSRWTQVPGGPGARSEAAMAFDQSSGLTVLFGGQHNGTPLGDTWLWDGASWSFVSNSDGRWGASMAYSPTLGKVIRYGGNAGGPVVFETLAFDVESGQWVDLGASGPISYGGPMVTALDYLQLYQNGQLWRFDGSWSVESAEPPSPSGTVQMAFDPFIGRPVVFGDSDTWEFTGSSWSFPEPRNAPDVRRSHVMAHDPRTRRSIIVGGAQNGGVYFDETWSYKWEGEREEACQSGHDVDGDGLVGCLDADCWSWCTPACLPGRDCPVQAPFCGNGTCDPLETPRLCRDDCGSPDPVCGDGLLDDGEADCLYDQHFHEP